MSTTSTAANTPCPRIEEIAALIDDRLSRKEREELTAHLGDCSVCYELFSETLRYQLEEKPAGDAQVVPHPATFTQRSAWAAGLAVAAAALIAGVFLLPRSADLGRDIDPALVVGALMKTDRPTGTLAANTYSGADWDRAFVLQQDGAEAPMSFRLGVRMVDLEASMRAGNADQAEELLTEVIETAEGLASATDALAAANELLTQIPLEGSVAELSAGRDHLDSLLAETSNGAHYAFGKWVETGLLASRVGSTGVMSSHEFRYFSTRFEQGSLPDDIESALARAEDLLAKQPLDMDALEEAFLDLVSRGGNI